MTETTPAATDAGEMYGELRNAVVRVLAPDKSVVGAGFLIDPEHVLTCAHVIAYSLGLPEDSPTVPDGRVVLDFPLLRPGSTITAHVVHWRPVQIDAPPAGVDDVAVLELESTVAEAVPVRTLPLSDQPWGHHFATFGFPADHPEGVWAAGILRAPQSRGWLQIENDSDGGYSVAPGFSGAPVWDLKLDRLVGMVVASERASDTRAAYIIPTDALIADVPQFSQGELPACPYRGLFAFREEDARFFFGRESISHRLADAVKSEAFIAVIGPSGSGKSSVVFAGMIPEMRHNNGYKIVTCRPTDPPFSPLASALQTILDPKESEALNLEAAGTMAKGLKEGTFGLRDVVSRLAQLNRSMERLVLVIDQFEELYAPSVTAEARQAYLDTLIDLVGSQSHEGTPRATIVITLRADFYGDALSYRPLADVLRSARSEPLGPMTRDELRCAIEQPALAAGATLEDGLTDRILDSVGQEPGNLPLVEFALTLLWSRQQHRKLTHAAYDEIGGVERALSQHAEEVYEELSAEDKLRAQHVFPQLVQPGTRAGDTRRVASRAELGEDNWKVVPRLASARLVVTSRDESVAGEDGSGQETVEVVHEALIRSWDRLHGWMETDRKFRQWQERLRTATREWLDSDRGTAALWRGKFLREAEDWQRKRGGDLSPTERAFIRASRRRVYQFVGSIVALAVIAVAMVYGLIQYFAPAQPEAVIAQKIRAKGAAPGASELWIVDFIFSNTGSTDAHDVQLYLHFRGRTQARENNVSLVSFDVKQAQGMKKESVQKWQDERSSGWGSYYYVDIPQLGTGDGVDLQAVFDVHSSADRQTLAWDEQHLERSKVQGEIDLPDSRPRVQSQLENDLADLVSYSQVERASTLAFSTAHTKYLFKLGNPQFLYASK